MVYLAINASLTGCIQCSYFTSVSGHISGDTIHFAPTSTPTPLGLPSAALCRLRSTILVVTFRSSWVSTATPSSTTFPPSTRCPGRSLRPHYPHPHRFTGETSSAVYNFCADLQTFCRDPRRCSKLEWRGADFDFTSAAGIGAPTAMRAREKRGRRTMVKRMHRFGETRRVDGKRTGGEWHWPMIIACRRRALTRARVFGPPQGGRYLPPCRRTQSPMLARAPLAEGRARLRRHFSDLIVSVRKGSYPEDTAVGSPLRHRAETALLRPLCAGLSQSFAFDRDIVLVFAAQYDNGPNLTEMIVELEFDLAQNALRVRPLDTIQLNFFERREARWIKVFEDVFERGFVTIPGMRSGYMEDEHDVEFKTDLFERIMSGGTSEKIFRKSLWMTSQQWTENNHEKRKRTTNGWERYKDWAGMTEGVKDPSIVNTAQTTRHERSRTPEDIS
ncbi:hypothetical protein K438DRAFT_2136547 [Mycena galopus ATCC 62051]|nr:hypothetical protein K438DRAFT_2136547 [Mycena galopus ATCC 62051]